MPAIESIVYKKILNSHLEFTSEFAIKFIDGSVGKGASPKGETISIYEDSKKRNFKAEAVIERIKNDGIINNNLKQLDFDDYLIQHIDDFGRNNTFALSLAFYNGNLSGDLFNKCNIKNKQISKPYLCCNILNGGFHAYTNPVLSDFSEYLLVAKIQDYEELIFYHNQIQNNIKEKLCDRPKAIINGNIVSQFEKRNNHQCIEFLLSILEKLKLKEKFDLMIDASAGDLWNDSGYKLSITDQSIRSSNEFCEYWINLIKKYDIRFLEDPFHEKDFDSWKKLANSKHCCKIIGDNLYSSDSKRILDGAENSYSHGVIIKPNQAGTVTSVCLAIETSQQNRQIPITSHRSISTESTFLSTLTCAYGVPYIKIGPLATDFSSVIRLNEIIRILGDLN